MRRSQTFACDTECVGHSGPPLCLLAQPMAVWPHLLLKPATWEY